MKYDKAFKEEAIREIAEMVAAEVAGGRIKLVYDVPDSNLFGYAVDTKLRLCSDKLRSLVYSDKSGPHARSLKSTVTDF